MILNKVSIKKKTENLRNIFRGFGVHFYVILTQTYTKIDQKLLFDFVCFIVCVLLGWAEALGQEYEQISYQCMQAREEMRLLRHKIYTTEEEILALQLEYEEQEMELDTMDVKSMEVMQLNHLREIQTAETQARRHWQKMIFREKVHWKITSNRANRVARHRERTKHVIEHSKQGRTIDFYTTVDYEKKKQREDYEHFIQEEQFTFDASERDRLAKPKTYEAYGSKLQVHFDDMIAKNLQFLRGMTLDERGSRLRQQHRTVEVKALFVCIPIFIVY